MDAENGVTNGIWNQHGLLDETIKWTNSCVLCLLVGDLSLLAFDTRLARGLRVSFSAMRWFFQDIFESACVDA